MSNADQPQLPAYGQKRFRWYIIVPWILFLVAIPWFFAAQQVAKNALTQAPHFDSGLQLVYVLTGLFLELTAVVWSLLAIPWFFAGDVSIRWKSPPQRILHALFTHTVLPIVLCAGLLVAIVAVILFVSYNVDPINRKNSVYLLVPFAAGWVVLLPVSWMVRRAVIRRFVINLRTRQVCYKCGYDLRSNPDEPCPECGFDPKMVEVELKLKKAP